MLRIAVVDDEPIILKKIVGRNSVEQSDIDCGKVTNCYNTGSVSGRNNVGDILGYNFTYRSEINCGKVTNCYNTGSVNGMPSINNDS